MRKRNDREKMKRNGKNEGKSTMFNFFYYYQKMITIINESDIGVIVIIF